MASTYSTSFRFELIATGEKSGTWGTTTNTNLGTLLEQAIGGYVSIAMSDANYTLVATNGASDEARNMTIRLTGTLTAGRNVSCPNSIEKIYFVDNATNQTITFKTASGTGVAIPTGTKAIVYADGTNVVAATGTLAAQAASAVAITGGTITGITDLAVADGGTGASTAANARTNLSAAASGANTDITSVFLSNTGLKVRDTDASHGLSIVPGSNLTADRVLTVTTGDAARTLDISAGSVTISAAAATVLDDASVGAMLTTMGGLSTTTAASTYLTTATATSTYAPLASPALTGNPTAPTPTAGDNDTSIATTAFVTTAVAGASVSTWVKIAENLALSGSTWAQSVTLTSYNSIVIKYDAVGGTQTGGSTFQVNGAGISSATGTTGATHTGMLWIELLSGYCYTGTRSAVTISDNSIGVTTATTTLTFGRAGGTMTAGSVVVYGVR